MKIAFDILGSGMAGKAAARAVYALQLAHPQLEIESPRFLERGSVLEPHRGGATKRILVIASPHALHASSILAGVAAGYNRVIVEKPSCVSLEEIEQLRSLTTPVAVCHGYRHSWGFRRLREKCSRGDLGTISAIEGRYWQSSIAERARAGVSRTSWKSDANVNGTYDVLLDLGTHWADLVFSILGPRPTKVSTRLQSTLVERPRQDTHVTIATEYPGDVYAYASLSKVAHGFGNDLEIVVFGSRGAALWRNTQPDVVEFSSGALSTSERRTEPSRGSGLPPFHALGWNEGYVELFYDVVRDLHQLSFEPYPTLTENLAVIEALLLSEKTFA